MNNLKVTVLCIMVLSALSLPAFAQQPWEKDASALEGATGIPAINTITDFKASIDKFQPPPPCVDTAKDKTFQLGTPATLSCSGASAGGSQTPEGAGTFNEQLQQTQPKDESGVFH